MEGLVKKTLHTDSAEQTGAVFGVLDKNIKELENAFGVTVGVRTQKKPREIL